MQQYSQTKALWAVTRASFKAIFAHPASIFFSLMFPIIFVLIFGAFGNGSTPVYRIAIAQGSDTSVTNQFYQGLKNHPQIRIIDFKDTVARRKEMVRGKLTGIVSILPVSDSLKAAAYVVRIVSTSASNNTIPALERILDDLKLRYQLAASGFKEELITMMPTAREEVRKYRSIDFVLPGQLGFSILFSTLFGIAFTFFNLRESLVLKRFYASPVNRTNILLGVGASRLFYQLLSVIVLILFGHYVLNFTLQHGVFTFLEILIMTVVMLFLLMGVGLIFSSIVKSDTSIPLLINLFGFPQMMLSGTFFSIDVFPAWLQEICKLLPLTQYNDAIRKISFEGLHITDCLKELGIMGIWIAVIYIILGKVLKWE
ncbi:MAG TPA: ABC transporter permease [Chitinophagaceae bacterium]|nr:ABC transporter permease [Chitinophagaceae bacterium]HNA91195.1 ABC transporter permease [Chitinophagaceae bacterium]HND96766.1 ABC transporter permease [Chitinophagaceae bacterium]